MIKTLVWASKEENIEAFEISKLSQKVSFFFSDVNDTTFKSVLEEYKKSGSSRILKIKNDNTFELIFKRNSVWTTIKFNDLVTYSLIANNYSVSNKDEYVPCDLNKGKKDSGITYPFNVEENIKAYGRVIDYLISEGSLKEIREKLNDDMVKVTKEVIKLEDGELFERFGNDVSSKNLPGIQKEGASYEKGLIKVKTKFGEIFLKNDSNEVTMTSYFRVKDNKIAELHSFSNGILINIKNHLTQNKITTNVPKKIKMKDVIVWALSLAVVITLLYATFNFIFSPHNLSTSMKIIFSGYSWSHPWVYMMFINFFISLFIGPIIGILIFKATKPNEKIKWSNYANFFIAGQVRLVTVFLTGNSILATIFWAWYMSSATKIRTVGLAGMVASMSILRGILLLPIGSFFMIRGSFFNATILNELGMSSELIAILTLSWIGWIWHIIHNLSISLLIVMPPLHILWNKITLFKYRKQGNSEVVLNKMNTFEMNLINLKHSFKNIFKNKDRLYRVVLIIFLNIFIETFEFTFGLHMVEGYANNLGILAETSSYWNIFAISSVRYMSGFVYHVPVLNLLPGQGTGITDLTLKLSTQGVVEHAHINDGTSIDVINDIGEQTTFLMRFFNFYLRRIIALVIATVFITIALVKRGGRNE